VQRGSVVIFYNQLPEGGYDEAALHGGCPILKGEKWAANLIVWNGVVAALRQDKLRELLEETVQATGRANLEQATETVDTLAGALAKAAAAAAHRAVESAASREHPDAAAAEDSDDE
jgi:hypothetical protein